MRSGLLILLGLLVVTWFEFQVYPGHSYLQGETQLLVPMLERLDTPGFLSRDLVASNPAFAYTIYDEITQSLHVAAHLTFEQALTAQQLCFRFAAILGVFLIARALKISPLSSLLISGAVNAITHLAAPQAFVTNPEPTPSSFSVSLVLLAGGLLVNRNPLLAGLAAGFALLYDPVIATAFWSVLTLAWICDRSLRKLLAPAWPALVIFVLVLGNLVQLQSGLGSSQEWSSRIGDSTVKLILIRTPWVWVSNWTGTGMLAYKFLLVAGVWALACIWKNLDRLARWVTIGLAASGPVSVGVAMLLLAERSHLAVAATPARNLAFSVAISVLLCAASSWHAAQRKKWSHSLPGMAILIASILNAQVLDLLHGETDCASFPESAASVTDLARWASESTWGSSMFQFPDAGTHANPAIFRALSKRALWADWQSGVIVDNSAAAGQEWWSRWQTDMSKPYSSDELHKMFRLPIDYYVLERAHQLAGVKPAYVNSTYVVYDAQDLREKSR